MPSIYEQEKRLTVRQQHQKFLDELVAKPLVLLEGPVTLRSKTMRGCALS